MLLYQIYFGMYLSMGLHGTVTLTWFLIYGILNKFSICTFGYFVLFCIILYFVCLLCVVLSLRCK